MGLMLGPTMPVPKSIRNGPDVCYCLQKVHPEPELRQSYHQCHMQVSIAHTYLILKMAVVPRLHVGLLCGGSPYLSGKYAYPCREHPFGVAKLQSEHGEKKLAFPHGIQKPPNQA